MKKTLKTGKKALSVFMAALMLLTAWVFFAPEKAEAATAGQYYYKVTFQVTNTMDNVQMLSTLYGRTNNGTGSEVAIASKNYTSDKDFSGTMTFVEGWTNAGVFPTRFHIGDNNGAKYYMDRDLEGYWHVYVGPNSTNLTEVYLNGVKHSSEAENMSVGSGKGAKWYWQVRNNWFTGKVNRFNIDYNVGSDYPYVNSVTWNEGNASTTVPKSGTNATVSTENATVRDQYGVAWHTGPYYALSESAGVKTKSETIPGITLSTYGTADTTTLRVTNTAKDWVSNGGKGYQRDVYINGYINGKVTSQKKVTITNCQYTATFVDGKTNDTLKTQSTLYYNYNTPEPPHVDELSTITDKDNHYVFNGKWEPEIGPIKGDTTYKSQYDAVEHTWKLIKTNEPTCVNTGSEIYECTVCTRQRTDTLAATGHTYVLEKLTDPTCTEKGYSTGYCSVCGWRGDYDYVPELGHNLVLSKDGTTAKCESEGTARYVCTREGCKYYEDRLVDKLGHDFSVITYDPEPTCTTSGREFHKCSRCSAFDPAFGGSDGVSVGALGHDWGEWEVTKKVSCEADGAEKRVCSRNAAHFETRVITRLGHKIDRANLLTEPATCTKAGYTYYKCVNDGCDKIEKVSDIPALGHDRDNAKWVTTVEPTCTKDGIESLICGREGCDAVLETRPAGKLGHEFREEAYKLYSPATCTEPAKERAKCSRCDVLSEIRNIEGSIPLGHDFREEAYKLYSPATCTKNRFEIATCSRCEETKIREVANTALGHIHEKKIPVPGAKPIRDANCTEDKIILIKCDRCNEESGYEQYIVPNSALGHKVVAGSWVHDEGTETCCDYGTKTGLCSVCGKNFQDVDDSVLAPHVMGEYVHDEGSETCEKDGTKTRRCQNLCHNGKGGDGEAVQCEYTETVTDEGTRIPHKFPDEEKNPEKYISNNDGTCLRDGTRTAVCEYGCGAKRTITDPDSKKDHKFVTWISDGNATCEKDGTKHSYCMYGCGTLTENVPDEGSALGHNFRDWEYEYNNDATCVKDGTRTARCENEFPTGEVDEEGNPIMARCEATDTLPAEGTKLGHKWGEWTAVGEKASCKNGGEFERHCENKYRVAITDDEGKITGYKEVACDAKETKKVEKLAHSFEWTIVGETDESGKPVNTDCTVGYYKVKKCSICGYIDESSKTLVKGEHNPALRITKPTCTEDGKREVYCTICNKVLETETLSKTGHINTELDKKTVVAATCAKNGYTGDIVCVACGEVVEKGTETDLTTNHIFTKYEKLSDATCTENEKEIAYCDVCGKATDTREVPFTALGHEYSEKVYTVKTKATCTEDEVREYRCMHFFTDAEGNEVQCENVKTVTVRSTATGHKWGEWKTVKEATCAEAGKAERKCLNDGCTVSITKPLRKLSHTPSDWIVVKEATCETEGYRYKKCTAGCGYIYEEEIIPKAPHDFEITECTATCLDDGYSTYVCKVCKTVKKGEIVKALGHDWSGSWVVTKQPTCTAKGSETLTCTRCDATQTRKIDALGHHEVIDPAVPATCTKEGLTEGSHCDRCGEILKKQETVVKPHYDGDGDGKCDECGKEIHHSTDLNCNCICHKTFWLMRLQYKILRFFWKIFKIGKSCDCGATHY